GLTTNLLTTSSGAKMGKTAQGAVWLNDDMLPVYDYWQFWRNTEDADVGRFLRLFTELPLDEITRLEKLEGAELNDAKKILATEATAMCHGRDAAEKAEATAHETFEGGGTSADLPSVAIDAKQLAEGLGLLEAFVIAGLAKSNGEARRLVQGGGAKVNDAAQNDIAATLTEADVQEGCIKLSFGKKRHVLLRP
ncbi:MAG: tyrosine--tRNA ligase, partial [Alphaproteobacteria bacterium]|nr:tyrosine--tRNA ligase [Alphaproteobacteria bacterium]